MSSHEGNDCTNCGSKILPCKTLARGVEIADWNDRIFLDGTFNKLYPYTCGRVRNNNFKSEGHHITIHVSLEFVAFRSRVLVNCGDELTFADISSKRQGMKVKFTGIVFYNTSMTFIDSSVVLDNCSFFQSIHPVDIWLSVGTDVTVLVKNSSFFNNTVGIRLQPLKADTLAGKYKALAFVEHHQNQPLSMGDRDGSVSLLVGINIFCDDTKFSENTGPLIENAIYLSQTNEYYHRVTLTKNSARSNSLYISKAKLYKAVFSDLLCADNVETRCIHIESSEVSLGILSSNISGHNVTSQDGAGIFVKGDEVIYSFISDTTFQRNNGKNGGAIAFQSLNGDVNVTLNKCNLVHNSGDNGGALSVTTQNGRVIVDVKSSIIAYCRAKDDGGAFYVTTVRRNIFSASNSTWIQNMAMRGSAIFLSSQSKHLKTKSVKTELRDCKFIQNYADVDSPRASVFIIATSGRVNVFETEWTKNVNCFFVECNCNVNFTKVNITSTLTNAVNISSGDVHVTAGYDPALKVHFERCIFKSNKENHMIINSKAPYLYLVLNDVQINGERMQKRGTKSVLDVLVASGALGSMIRLQNVVVKKATGSASVILRIHTNKPNKVEIVNSVFRKIRSVYSDRYRARASPLSIIMPWEDINDKDCNSSYLRFSYINTIVILNTTFKDNIGRASGGVFLSSGNVTIRNCCLTVITTR